jgi:hypothetical protein
MINNTHVFSRNEGARLQFDKITFAASIETKSEVMSYCQRFSPSRSKPIVCSANSSTCPLDLASKLPKMPKSCDRTASNFYKLTSSNINIYTHMRHVGFPLFVGSFDLYLFLVSLMLETRIYQTVINDDNLTRLWMMMWLPEDIDIVNSEIVEQNKAQIRNREMRNVDYNNTSICLDIIKGRWLRCDAVEHMWNLIKEIAVQ